MALKSRDQSTVYFKQIRACSHGGGGPFHMRGGVPHLGGLPGQPCRVTRLGGVSFLHVNADGGVG